MTHVNTIKNNSTTYTYDQLQQMVANGTLDSSKITDVSVFSASSDSSECTDGKDDGKIGFFSAFGSTLKGAVKGVVNGIKGMFTDDEGNFSLTKTLKTAALTAACFIPGVGPVIAGGLCAYGAVKGGIGVAKGVAAVANATTDAEAKAAFESIGANGVATAASVAGLKASTGAIVKNMGGEAGSISSNVSTIAGKLKSSVAEGTGITGKLSNAANTLTGNYYKGTWSSATEGASGIKKYIKGTKAVVTQGADGTAQNIVKTGQAINEKVKNTTDKITGKTGSVKNLPEGATYNEQTGNYEVKSADGATKKVYTKNAETGNYDFTTEAGEALKVVDSKQTTTKGINNGGGESSTTTVGKNSGLSEAELTSIKNGGTVTKDGYTYSLNEEFMSGNNMTLDQINSRNIPLTKTTANSLSAAGKFNKATSAAKNYTNNASWQGGIDTSYIPTAGKTVVANSIGNEADKIQNQIPYANTTYATVNTQTGYEYDLQDYSILSDDELNQKYAEIMNQAYSI